MFDKIEKRHNILLLHVNCQSYGTAWPDLDLIIQNRSPDVICLQETNRPASSPISIPGYTSFPIHRVFGESRGSTLLVKSTIPATRLPADTPNPPVESIIVDLQLTHRSPLRIVAIYAPQGSLPVNFIRNVLTNHPNSILVGDLNARHPSFGDTTTNVNGTLLNDLFQEGIIFSANPGIPTRYSQNIVHPSPPSIIDYIIGTSSTFPKIKDFEVHDPITSDHRPISATIVTSPFTPCPSFSPKPDFAKANWSEYKKEIDEKVAQLPRIANNRTSIDSAISSLTSIMQTAGKNHIPTTTYKPRKPLPPSIIRLIKARKKLLRSFQDKPTREKKTRINALRNEIHAAIQTYREDHLVNLWNSISVKSPSSYWSTVRRFMKPGQATSTTPLVANGSTFTSPSEQTKCFYDLYQDIHSIPPPRPGHDDLNRQVNDFNDNLNDLRKRNSTITEFSSSVSPADIIDAIKKTRNTSPGLDNLYYAHVKNLPVSALRYLASIYESSFNTKYFPDAWKLGTTILIPKPKKDHSNPRNYRPITLLPALGKTFERLINARLMHHLESTNKINDHQSGYRKNRSTADPITRLVQHATRNVNQGNIVLAAFYDVEKAFDKVWHEGLLFKLRHHADLSIGLILLIQSFLNNRRTRFKVKNELSDSLSLPAGTPQGSVLSPTLFLLWVNDLPKPPPPLKKNGQEQYADDLTAWSAHRWLYVAEENLQSQNNDIESWSHRWRSTYNATKTQFLAMSRKRLERPAVLFVQNQRITNSPSATSLGVTLDSRLNFNAQFKSVYDRVKKRIALLRPIAGNIDHPRAPPHITISIYNTMIRPIMEYAPLAAMMLKDSHFELLESLRIKAHKIAFGIPNTMDKRYALEYMNNETPQLRIGQLASKYMNSDKRPETIKSLLREVNAKPLTLRNPLRNTPMGRVLRL